MLSARSDFLARFGHDLRAPLSSLTGVLRLLAGEAPLPEAMRAPLARQALAASLQLQCQIDDAVTLSRLESGGPPVAPGPLDLRALLVEVLADLDPVSQALEVGLRVTDTRDPTGTPDLVMATPALLRRLLDSLGHQALRYAVRGHVVTVDLRRQGTRRVMHWRRFAPGRGPQQLGPVFEPFGTDASGAMPAGLGLRLARDGMAAMGGRLSLVASADGQDTDLLLDLPMPAAADAQASNPEQTSRPATDRLPAQAAMTDAAVPPGVEAVTRMLLVEDDPVHRRLVQHYLRARPGIELQVAVNGAQGLAMVRDWQPSLLVTDLRLPDMSGQVLMQRLTDECGEWRQGAQCVAFSADLPPIGPAATPGSPVQADLFDAAWRKPLDSAQFLAAVDRLLLAGADPARPLALQSV